MFVMDEQGIGIMKKFLASRCAGFYITSAALVCQILSIIFYAVFGVSEYNPDLLVVPFVMSGLVIMIDIASLILGWKLMKQISFLLSLYALIAYFGSQVNYIANVLVSIDGSTFSVSFVFTALFFLLAGVGHFVSVFFDTLVLENGFKILDE